MKYLPLTNFLMMFLFSREAFSKSFGSHNVGSYSSDLNTDTDPDQFGSEENPNTYENVGARHKFKVGGGPADSNRFARTNIDGQDNRNPQCAVMFKNSEPVGILQPFEDSYKFLPVNGDPTIVDINPLPIKRKSIVDVLYPSVSNFEDDYEEEKPEDRVGFSDERYPSIFAKFKIDSRLDKVRGTNDFSMKRSMLKRESEPPNINENQLGSLKTTLSKIKEGDNTQVEEELKSILDDMGLIDDYPDREMKREADNKDEEKTEVEDENLEFGTNKIELVKEGQRGKRGFMDLLSKDCTTVRADFGETTQSGMGILKSDNLVKVHGDSEIAECSSESAKFKRDDKASADIDPRKKRAKSSNEDEMPLLERSTPPTLAEEGDINKYEKRVEREIRDKIQKLREEVKKEIEDLKASKSKGSSDNDLGRKKRQVNTLMDEETKDIDPNFNSEGDQKVHIRRKRTAPQEQTALTNQKAEKTTKQEIKLNISTYRLRSLKQINPEAEQMENEDYNSQGNSLKERQELQTESEEAAQSGINIRGKREIKEVLDALTDDNDDSEVDEDHDPIEKENDDADRNSVSGYILNNDSNCNCDKKGSNCKCKKSKRSSDKNPFNFDYSHLLLDPLPLEKKSANKNCDCDKNGNCKCGKMYADQPAAAVQDYDYDNLEKRSANNFLDGLGTDLGFDSLVPKFGNNKDASRLGSVGYLQNHNYEADSDYQNLMKRAVKARKSFENGEYFVDLHPDIYRLTPVETFRQKRDNFDSMVAIHGGGPVRSHLVAIRQRSMLPHSRFRRRSQTEDNTEPRQLINMSEEELFGALPQSYEGELNRYKRVKRTRK